MPREKRTSSLNTIVIVIKITHVQINNTCQTVIGHLLPYRMHLAPLNFVMICCWWFYMVVCLAFSRFACKFHSIWKTKFTQQKECENNSFREKKKRTSREKNQSWNISKIAVRMFCNSKWYIQMYWKCQPPTPTDQPSDPNIEKQKAIDGFFFLFPSNNKKSGSMWCEKWNENWSTWARRRVRFTTNEQIRWMTAGSIFYLANILNVSCITRCARYLKSLSDA